MADYSSGFLYFATLPDAILCREGDGQICPMQREKLENGELEIEGLL